MKVVLHDLQVVPAVADPAGATTVASDVPDALARLADALAAGPRDEPVLLVVPGWSGAAVRTARTARAALDRATVQCVEVGLPPAAASVVASLALRLAPRLPHPGMLSAAVRVLEEQVASYALLRSVTGLDRVQPSLGQHVASWTPNSRFLVVTSPDSSVQRVTRRAPLELPGGGEGRATLVTGPPGELREELASAARRRFETPPPVEVDAVPGAARWWGSDDVAEGVEWPGDLDRLADDVRRRVGPVRTCGWCGQRVPTGPCALCGHDDAA